jgi:hypothetical protein
MKIHQLKQYTKPIKQEVGVLPIPKIGQLYQSTHSRMIRDAMINLMKEGRTYVGLKALYNQIERDNPDIDIQKSMIYIKRALIAGLKNGAFKSYKNRDEFSSKFALGPGKKRKSIDGDVEEPMV